MSAYEKAIREADANPNGRISIPLTSIPMLDEEKVIDLNQTVDIVSDLNGNPHVIRGHWFCTCE